MVVPGSEECGDVSATNRRPLIVHACRLLTLRGLEENLMHREERLLAEVTDEYGLIRVLEVGDYRFLEFG
ncbi:MAG: hypothetical protein AB7E18_05545, partial [Stutzerimonas sp.]